MPIKPKKRWCWEELEERDASRPKHAQRNWRKPEYRRNRDGVIVRDVKEKERKPAVERLYAHIKEIDECWIYKGGAEQIEITPGVVMSPWRFIYEVHHGKPVPKHARFGRTCETPKCCRPGHLFVIEKPTRRNV